MIYDAFLFFNELDLLELRLNILSPVVDRFVISESTVTFSGKPKPLYFHENKQRFSQFLSRIDHHVVDDTPANFVDLRAELDACDIMTPAGRAQWQALSHLRESTHFNKAEAHWGRDFYQREILLRAVSHCKDEDFILVSDLDEIPNPEVIKKVQALAHPSALYIFQQWMFYYFVNCLKTKDWFGTRGCFYRRLRNGSPNYDRMSKDGAIILQDGGWHFSFLGGAERIRTKLESYGHQEYNTASVKMSVEQHLQNNTDLFGRPGTMQVIPISHEYFPAYLVENIGRYNQFVRQ